MRNKNRHRLFIRKFLLSGFFALVVFSPSRASAYSFEVPKVTSFTPAYDTYAGYFEDLSKKMVLPEVNLPEISFPEVKLSEKLNYESLVSKVDSFSRTLTLPEINFNTDSIIPTFAHGYDLYANFLRDSSNKIVASISKISIPEINLKTSGLEANIFTSGVSDIFSRTSDAISNTFSKIVAFFSGDEEETPVVTLPNYTVVYQNTPTVAPAPLPPPAPSPVIVRNTILGSQGAQGVQGTTGVTGPQGIQGPQGPRGATGSTPDLGNYVTYTSYERQIDGLLRSLENSNESISESIATQVSTALLNVSGDSTMGGNLTVSGNITGNILGTINPAFTLGSIPFQGASGLTEDNSNFFWDDTNNRLGIGTTTPTNSLTVWKDQAYNAGIGVSTMTQIQVRNDSPTGFAALSIWGAGAEQGRMQYNAALPNIFFATKTAIPFYLGTNDIVRMTINANGNVGVGTNAPTANFQVAQSTVGVGTVSNTAGGTTVTGVGTQFTNTFKVGDTITIGSQTVAISAIASNTSMTTAAITNANTDVAYTLAGGTRFAVLGGGNVGIGITNPTTKLQVENVGIYSSGGFNYVQSNDTNGGLVLQANGTGAVGVKAGSNGFQFNYNNSSTGSLIWYGGSATAKFTLTNAGAIDMESSLRVRGTFDTQSDWRILNKVGSGWVTVGTRDITGTEAVMNLANVGTLTASGNVGIGTTTPTLGKLQVLTSGTKAAVFEGVDANGYNSWFRGTNASLVVGQNNSKSMIQGLNVGATAFGDVLINPYGSNVGIGTTNPGAKLDVNGSLTISSSTGQLLLPNGSSGAPSILFGTGYGLYAVSGSIVNTGTFQSLGGLTTGSNLAWTNGDLFLNRDAANTLAMRNTTNAQTFRLYNTYTDASNYERGVFDWGTNSNVLSIGTQAAGTGTVRNIALIGGNVGIGITNPGQLLQVEGANSNIKFRGNLSSGTYGYVSQSGTAAFLSNNAYSSDATTTNFTSDTTGVGAAQVMVDRGFIALRVSAATLTTPIGWVEGMRVISSGFVGIGTTAPVNKLQVAVDVAAYPTTGVYGQIEATGLTSTAKRLSLGYNTTANTGFIQAVTNGNRFDDIVLNPANGNVLVGNTTSSAKFQVYQGTSGRGTVSTTSGGTTVTGVTTEFLNTFKVGDTITINTETKTISAIASNTSMTTDAWTGTNTNIGYTLVGGTRFNVLGSGNVGIGTTNPGSKLEVSGGSVTITQLDSNVLGYNVKAYDTTASGGGGQNIFERAGGTLAAPSAVTNGMSLGSLSFRGYNGSAFTGSKAYISASVTENWSTTANGTGLMFKTTPNGSTTLTDRLFIDNNGNVGIGTTGSPGAKLEVITSDTVIGGNFTTTKSGTTNALQANAVTSNGASENRAIYANAINAGGGSAFSFYGAGGTLYNAGNVGIGITNPGATLTVKGTSGNIFQLVNSAGNAAFTLDNSQLQAAFWGNLNVQYPGITFTGDTDTGMNRPAANTLTFVTNATEKMRIDALGNVMIGGTAARATTAGTNQLILFDGTAPVGTLANGISMYSTAGEAYIMDAAGNATLQSPHENENNYWVFDSRNAYTGKTLLVDMELLIKDINDSLELDYVHETQDGEITERSEGTILSKLFSKITLWMADAGNGIGEVFGGTFKAKDKLCINDTCVTEDELKALIQNSGSSNSSTTSVPTTPEPEPSTPSEPAPTIPVEETPVADIPTTVEPEVTPAEEAPVVAEPEPAPAESPAPEPQP